MARSHELGTQPKTRPRATSLSRDHPSPVRPNPQLEGTLPLLPTFSKGFKVSVLPKEGLFGALIKWQKPKVYRFIPAHVEYEKCDENARARIPRSNMTHGPSPRASAANLPRSDRPTQASRVHRQPAFSLQLPLRSLSLNCLCCPPTPTPPQRDLLSAWAAPCPCRPSRPICWASALSRKSEGYEMKTERPPALREVQESRMNRPPAPNGSTHPSRPLRPSRPTATEETMRRSHGWFQCL
jgi:hypothetical protein